MLLESMDLPHLSVSRKESWQSFRTSHSHSSLQSVRLKLFLVNSLREELTVLYSRTLFTTLFDTYELVEKLLTSISFSSWTTQSFTNIRLYLKLHESSKSMSCSMLSIHLGSTQLSSCSTLWRRESSPTSSTQSKIAWTKSSRVQLIKVVEDELKKMTE